MNSSLNHALISVNLIICGIIIVTMSGCYSFTGGAIPEHLSTIYIAPVTDNSGFGNPQYREDLYSFLLEEFRQDGSFEIADNGGDARLEITISNISEESIAVTQNELESERKVQVTCKVEYFDNIKNKMLLEKSFSNYEVYDVNASTNARDQAVRDAIDQLSEDILLGVVSGW